MKIKVVNLKKNVKRNLIIAFSGLIVALAGLAIFLICNIEPAADGTTLSNGIQDEIVLQLGMPETVEYSVSNRDATTFFAVSDPTIFDFEVSSTKSEIILTPLAVGEATLTMRSWLKRESVTSEMKVTVVDPADLPGESGDDDGEAGGGESASQPTKTEFDELIEGRTLDETQAVFALKIGNDAVSEVLTVSGLDEQFLTVKVSNFSAYLIDANGSATEFAYESIFGGNKIVTLNSTYAGSTLLLLGTDSSSAEFYYKITLI